MPPMWQQRKLKSFDSIKPLNLSIVKLKCVYDCIHVFRLFAVLISFLIRVITCHRMIGYMSELFAVWKRTKRNLKKLI